MTGLLGDCETASVCATGCRAVGVDSTDGGDGSGGSGWESRFASRAELRDRGRAGTSSVTGSKRLSE